MKKKLPLKFLEALQPGNGIDLSLVKVIKDDDTVISFVEKDENSNFFFKILNITVNGSDTTYRIGYRPCSSVNINSSFDDYDPDETIKQFINWIEILNKYNKLQSIDEDPIIRSNQERFEKQFQILDADADYASFNLPQQLYLDEYLMSVKSKIIDIQVDRSEEDIVELTELDQEASEIQKVLTKESKSQIMKRFSKFWAKAQKIGLPILRELFIDYTTELTKKLLTNG